MIARNIEANLPASQNDAHSTDRTITLPEVPLPKPFSMRYSYDSSAAKGGRAWYCRPGDRREHKIKEHGLWILMQAGLALRQIDRERALPAVPMDRPLRLELARSVERVETMIDWRERYG